MEAWVSNQDSPTKSQFWVSSPQAARKWKDVKDFFVSPLNGCFCLDGEEVTIIIMGTIRATTVAPMIY